MVHQQFLRLLIPFPGPGIGQGWLLIAQAVHIHTCRSGGVGTVYHLIAPVTVCVCMHMCTHMYSRVSFEGTVAMELGYQCESHYCAASDHLLCLLYAFAGPLFCCYYASSVLSTAILLLCYQPHCCAVSGPCCCAGSSSSCCAVTSSVDALLSVAVSLLHCQPQCCAVSGCWDMAVTLST